MIFVLPMRRIVSSITSALLVMGSFVPTLPALAAEQTVSLTPVADTYIQSGFTGENYGTQDSVFLSLAANNRSRVLLRFDLSAIPANATISSAQVEMFLTSATSGSIIDTWVGRLDSTWSESAVTWDNQPAVAASTDMIRITRVPEDRKLWDITTHVAYWMANPEENHGVSIYSRDSGTTSFTYGYGSREFLDPEKRPILHITYDAAPDIIPPVVSGTAVQNIGLTSATAVFTTDEATTATVEYGLTETYGRTIQSSAPSQNHSMSLTLLAPGSTYHYRIRASDAAGNEIITNDATFTTPNESGLFPAGTLVKLPDDQNPQTQVDTAVYYVGTDGKRHGFPNDRIYQSWYADFSSVNTITPTEMAALPLGANVTYRPGVRMVKFQTLPKVYAMDRGGTLRWVASESVASSLYGPTWNTKIDDLSDAFFTNYTFGTDINSPADFNPSGVTSGTATIDQDQGR